MAIVQCNHKNECCQPHDMAFVISFTDYKSGKLPLTGHSAVLLINGASRAYCAYDFAKGKEGYMGIVRRYPGSGYSPLTFNKDCLPGRESFMNLLDTLCGILGEDWYKDISDSIVGVCGCGYGFAAADALGEYKRDHYETAKKPTATEPEYGVFEYNCATFAVEIASTLWGIPANLKYYHPQTIHANSFHALVKEYRYTSFIRGKLRTLDCPCASST